MLRYPEARFDAVRCGIAVYGLSPFGTDPADDGLTPAIRLESFVAEVKLLATGESAGYGRRFVAAEPMWIGLVPVGYADGVPRILSGKADVLVRGRRRLVAATVSMHQLMFVIGSECDVAPGDAVTLIGEDGRERILRRGVGPDRRHDQLRDRDLARAAATEGGACPPRCLTRSAA